MRDASVPESTAREAHCSQTRHQKRIAPCDPAITARSRTDKNSRVNHRQLGLARNCTASVAWPRPIRFDRTARPPTDLFRPSSAPDRRRCPTVGLSPTPTVRPTFSDLRLPPTVVAVRPLACPRPDRPRPVGLSPTAPPVGLSPTVVAPTVPDRPRPVGLSPTVLVLVCPRPSWSWSVPDRLGLGLSPTVLPTPTVPDRPRPTPDRPTVLVTTDRRPTHPALPEGLAGSAAGRITLPQLTQHSIVEQREFGWSYRYRGVARHVAVTKRCSSLPLAYSPAELAGW